MITISPRRLLVTLAVCLTALLGGCAHHATTSPKPTTITFWHAMSGPYAKALDHVIADYNHSQ